MYATTKWNRNTDVVKILLENGADINARNYDGMLHNIISVQYFYHLYITLI